MYSNLLLTPLKPKGWSLGERCSKTFAKPWPVKYPAMVWLGVGWERLTLTGVSNSSLTILGDPGAVSWAGLKGETKLFKRGQKSSWVPTLTGPFPNGQENAGSWLGTKNVLYYCAQIIGEQFLLCSFREFVHDGCYLATVAWFVH